MSAKDSLFSSPLGDIERFKFNQAVVDVFPDMLRRSVPGYESIITQSALLASRYVQPDTHLYDLGSSLGATAISMRDALVNVDPALTQGCEIHSRVESTDSDLSSHSTGVESTDLHHSSHSTRIESTDQHHSSHSTRIESTDPHHSSLSTRIESKELDHNSHSTHVESTDPQHDSHSTRMESIATHHNSHSTRIESTDPHHSSHSTRIESTDPHQDSHSTRVESPDQHQDRSANESIGTAEALTKHITPIIVHEADLERFPLENASVVAMNFTLQFVDVDARSALMKKIADALRPGGVLILSEKVCFSDPVVNEMHIDMYHAFKSANGYSDLEISQKRTALENVLIPDTLSTHHERLLGAGFSHVSVWFQCFNFASLIAIR